jgi:hypothetical protein
MSVGMTLLFTELEEMLRALTDADLLRSERKLQETQESDKVLGTVFDQETRRWWALADKLGGMTRLTQNQAEYTADSAEERETLQIRAARYSDMEDIAREVAYFQAKEAIGGEAWTVYSRGLRAGWLLVSITSRDPRRAMQMLMGPFAP